MASIFKVEEISSTKISKQAGGKLLARWFLAELIFSTLKMEAICSSETWLKLDGLHGVISQKMIHSSHSL
jgi:hypothetical protein